MARYRLLTEMLTNGLIAQVQIQARRAPQGVMSDGFAARIEQEMREMSVFEAPIAPVLKNLPRTLVMRGEWSNHCYRCVLLPHHRIRLYIRRVKLLQIIIHFQFPETGAEKGCSCCS